MRYTDNMVLFWGWRDPFSNFFRLPEPIELGGLIFLTSEHLFMYMKAMHFHDIRIANQILETTLPSDAKRLGKMIEDYDEAEWAEHSYDIMHDAVFLKFQHPWLKNMLLTTDDRILVEASPVDFKWGVGLAADNDLILDPANWPGLNLLGNVLMEVREELK